LFTPVNRFDRISEVPPLSRLYFDERNGALTFDHEIDVPMPTSESPLNDAPPVPPKPSLRDAFSQHPKRLPGR
jgi:hypothetical protein